MELVVIGGMTRGLRVSVQSVIRGMENGAKGFRKRGWGLQDFIKQRPSRNYRSYVPQPDPLLFSGPAGSERNPSRNQSKNGKAANRQSGNRVIKTKTLKPFATEATKDTEASGPGDKANLRAPGGPYFSDIKLSFFVAFISVLLFCKFFNFR